MGLEGSQDRRGPCRAAGEGARGLSVRLYDYTASGNCYKVRLLLALLGRRYERVAIDIFAGDTLTDAFAALNPLRETPVLELEAGATIAQSNAILWYLGEGTPFLPADKLERALVQQWLSFEQERHHGRHRRATLPAPHRPARAPGPPRDRCGLRWR